MPNINTYDDPIESANGLKFFCMGADGGVGWFSPDALDDYFSERMFADFKILGGSPSLEEFFSQRPFLSLYRTRTGIWYDPQDLTTLFQDAQGTLPVYRPGTGLVDPPVGLMLDKSQGLELGPELLTEEQTTFMGGWTVSGTSTISDGIARVYSPAGEYTELKTNANFTSPTSVLLVRVYVSNYVSGSVGTINGSTVYPLSPLGECEFIIANTGRSDIVFKRVAAPTDISFSSISIREIKGYHAYQSTTTARPTLRGRYNLLLATETLSTQSVTTVATNYTLRFEGTGTVTLSGTATGTYSAGTHTITCPDGTLTCTVAGSVTKADLRVKRDGSSLPAYQSVTNANTYDTVGFPLFLRRDKVDDDLIVQAPAITGAWAHGTLEGTISGTVAIPAGEYHPFGTVIPTNLGMPNCTQWIAINGTLSANDQLILERYVRAKSSHLIYTNPFMGVSFINDWFSRRVDITHLSCEDWNMSNITNCGSVFYGTRFSEIDVSRWDVSKCTYLANMFYYNIMIKSIDVSPWDTSSATNLSSFARDCTSLETLVLGSIDTSKVTNFRAFVTGSKITELDISSLDFSGVTGVPGDSNYDGFREFANRNSLLTTVIVGGAFNNTQTTNFMDAFTITNLNQASIDAILVSINTAGTSNGVFGQSGGSAPSATGQAAITAMRSRGWTVTVTGGF